MLAGPQSFPLATALFYPLEHTACRMCSGIHLLAGALILQHEKEGWENCCCDLHCSISTGKQLSRRMLPS
jgi:hypothetical protein